jgi:enoyl-CoA hydratase/carnithine racemase
MIYEDLLVEDRGAVTWITINRPEVMNALRPHTYVELINAFRESDSAPNTHFIILTGAGERAFSAGDDFKEVFLTEESIVGSESNFKFDKYTNRIGAVTPTVEAIINCTKPTIAVINGVAVGMGLDIALLCDMRIATTTATMGSFFVRRGFSGTIGSTVLLPRIIGLSRAMEMILSGEKIDGEEAGRLGIVSKVVTPENLDAAVAELIEKLSWGAPLAQRAIKRIVRKGLGVDLQSLEEYTRLLSDPLWETEDHNEGVMSHVEKRKPVFKAQ